MSNFKRNGRLESLLLKKKPGDAYDDQGLNYLSLSQEGGVLLLSSNHGFETFRVLSHKEKKQVSRI